MDSMDRHDRDQLVTRSRGGGRSCERQRFRFLKASANEELCELNGTVPSAKRLHDYGKSPIILGKLMPFQTAMLKLPEGKYRLMLDI